MAPPWRGSCPPAGGLRGAEQGPGPLQSLEGVPTLRRVTFCTRKKSPKPKGYRLWGTSFSRPHFEGTSKGAALDCFKDCVLEGFSKCYALGERIFPTPFLLTAPKETVSDRQRKAPCWSFGASLSPTGALGQDTRSIPFRCRSTVRCSNACTPRDCAWSALLSRQACPVDVALCRNYRPSGELPKPNVPR